MDNPHFGEISNERATELLAIGAHWIRSLHDGDEALTLSEVLVVLSSAVGLALAGMPEPDRAKLLSMVVKLAERTARKVRKL